MKTLPTTHSSYQPEQGKREPTDNTLTGYQTPVLRMAPDVLTKRNELNSNEQSDSNKPELPAHIEALIEQQKKIKEQIKEQKRHLEQLKARNDLDEESKATLVKQQGDTLTQLQLQLVAITQSLQDALKKAGIGDLGLLANVLV
ncbi:hypothetical protein [Pseudoalteromonas sp. A25]|uniref:hypothetical protein n=1 Tax=Pseudoalteromonas sp. A25 TaxID=116092 RepID=UPI001260B47B|nr:hypothetical protein [Pseudoalteromonas sp. A25]